MKLLRDPTLAWYFAGKLASTCGMWMQNIVAAILMFELTSSPFMVGIVSVAQFLGPLALAIASGAWSDRVDRRKLLILGRCISGAAVSTLAVLIAVRGVTGFGGPEVLVAGVLVLGVGMAISVPAMQALVPALVEPNKLESAVVLSSITPSIGRTLGPALGASVLLFGGPALGFVLAGLSHFFFAVVLLFIRPRRLQERPIGKTKLLGGVQYLLKDRYVGALMLAVAALGLASDTVVTLSPSKAAALGGGSEMVGFLATAFGAGAIVFLMVLGPLRNRASLRNVGTISYVLMAIGFLATGLAQSLAPAAVGMLVAGTGFMMGTVTLNTRIQMKVPDDVRGRVMALWVVAYAGSRPLAALINGSVAEFTSLRAAYIVGLVLIVAALPLVRVREGPDQANQLDQT